jgi:NitT/TauT family transport system substrate-binding protein
MVQNAVLVQTRFVYKPNSSTICLKFLVILAAATGHQYCKLVYITLFHFVFLEAHMIKRTFIKTTLGLALATSFASVSAQTTPLKFQLDWRFEGPAAFFLVPAAKGYFKDAKLDVTVDAGNGSGGAVNRVASGAYDVGFADLAALMEFHANNPDAPNKPVAVMMVYNNTPASVMALKKSGESKMANAAAATLFAKSTKK